jgi:hypothetical protein
VILRERGEDDPAEIPMYPDRATAREAQEKGTFNEANNAVAALELLILPFRLFAKDWHRPKLRTKEIIT